MKNQKKVANYPPPDHVYKVCTYNDLICSSAWNQLTGKSAIIYMHFLKKRIFVKSGKNRGKKEAKECINLRKLEFTIAEAEESWGISKFQFREAIKQLIKFGFIDIVQQGGTLWKWKSVYGLSEKWRDFK